MIDLSNNKLSLVLDITEGGAVIIKSFGNRYIEDERKGDPRFCNACEIHINGKNPDDHHFCKHTGGSETYTLKYQSHNTYENEYGKKTEIILQNDSIKATVHYQLYNDTAVLRAWTDVENISVEPIGLEYVASFTYTGFDTGKSPLNDRIKIFLPHNTWCRESNWKEYTLSDLGYEKTTAFSGKRISVSNTGSFSCKEYLPMGAISNTEEKCTYLWQIENNGSWQWEISDIDNMLYFKLSGPTEQENTWYKELLPCKKFESVKCAISVGADFNSALKDLTLYRRPFLSIFYGNGIYDRLFDRRVVLGAIDNDIRRYGTFFFRNILLGYNLLVYNFTTFERRFVGLQFAVILWRKIFQTFVFDHF